MTPMWVLTTRALIFVFHAAAWASAATLYMQVTQPHEMIDQKAIYVSLPVFVSSVIGTAVGTWTLARYTTEKLRRIERLEMRIEHMSARFGDHAVPRRESGRRED